ncbi:MAG: Flp pilus assembly protein CpaB [Chloroflexota bacterium]
MSGKGGKVAVVLAVGLGLGAAYLVHGYLDQLAQQAKPAPTAQVVTAATDIPARTVIAPAMLKLAEVPITAKMPQAVAILATVEGKVSKQAISRGEQLVPAKVFANRDESGLAFLVPPGKRAIAVGVNEVVGSGGLLAPGDSVDVLAVLDTKAVARATDKQPSASATPAPDVTAVAQYILQNVQVLAVAQHTENDQASQGIAAGAGAAVGIKQSQPAKQDTSAQPLARTVTLAVAPLEAERVVLAEDKGRIRLVLRPHGDNATIEVDDGLFSTQKGAAELKSGVAQ